jgi:hypothetical protein
MVQTPLNNYSYQTMQRGWGRRSGPTISKKQ